MLQHLVQLSLYCLSSGRLQYCAKRMQTNFVEIRLLFSRNFGGRSVIFRPKFEKNFAEPHESSNTGRKFANLTTKFRWSSYVLKRKFKNLIKIS